MYQVNTVSTEWGGRTLTLETGKFALLANAAVRAQYGDTVVLATITMSPKPNDFIGYFPLMVGYEEKLYAAGKIKGSRFIKREGRPTDLAVLNGRIIDRTLRPLFDHRIRNDIQVVVTVLSVDQEHDPAVVGLIAAAAATHISDIPAEGPVTGLAVGYVDGEYVLNPTPEQREKGELYMFMGVRDGQVVMVEAEGKEAPEDIVLGAFEFGLEHGKTVVDLVEELHAKAGMEKKSVQLPEPTEEEQAMREAVAATVQPFFDTNMESLFGIVKKKERAEKEAEFNAQMHALFETDEERAIADELFEHAYEEAFRSLMLEKEVRVDGRGLAEVRDLYAEVDMLPRAHGSALFQRGETQVLSVVTLAGPGATQIIDGLEPEYEKRYLHHYNFPPYSVGEAKPMRGPSRRDIGHGALAEKALEAVLPPKEEFPYTIRVVSEVLMSNGSSSQASACGSSLSLMAAGVPIKAPVAGIAMGLVTTDDRSTYKVLTDIQGIEDHSGDMDFKVAGTTQGVTAIQLDIKLGGITMDICRDTLAQARQAREQILSVMNQAITTPRDEMSPYAPRIESIQIDPERIGELIGPGGKVINGIIDATGVEIDIDDSGIVSVTAVDGDSMAAGLQMINDILKVVEVGEEYEGKVIKIVTNRDSGSEIGAIVDLGGGKDGMVHISNVCHGRIAKVTDVLNEGDTVKVKVMEVDHEKGRIGLSRKAMIEPGSPDPACEAASQAAPAQHAEYRRPHRDDRSDRPRRPRRDDRQRDRRS